MTLQPLVVVDGNNVMGSRPDGWWKDRAGAAKRLVAQLGDWAAPADRDVLVVFDGPQPDELTAPPRVDVRFARRRGRRRARAARPAPMSARHSAGRSPHATTGKPPLVEWTLIENTSVR